MAFKKIRYDYQENILSLLGKYFLSVKKMLHGHQENGL